MAIFSLTSGVLITSETAFASLLVIGFGTEDEIATP